MKRGRKAGIPSKVERDLVQMRKRERRESEEESEEKRGVDEWKGRC